MKIKFRSKNTTTLIVTAQQLKNIFDFLKGNDLYMDWYNVKAKTGVNGQLQFEIVIHNSVIEKITPDVALDAITRGMLR